MRALMREKAIKGLKRTSPAMLNSIRSRRLLKAAPQWLTLDTALKGRIQERVGATQTCPTAADGPYGMYFAEARTSLDHPLISWDMEESFESGKRMGIEFHHPYWNPDVIEMLWRTPPVVLNRGGRAKGLIREVAAKRFPALGFERQKKVEVGEYLFRLTAREAGGLWREVGGAKALVQMGLADADKLELYVKTILESAKGAFAEACKIFNILNIDTWLRAKL